jgi:hypothetical protein
MAHAHTTEQRKFIIERLAYGYTVELICQNFKRRFSDTDCKPDDVYSCDQAIVKLGIDEFMIHVAAVQFACENPEAVAPALNPTRRQLNTILSAEDARERKAYELMAKLYRQVDEAQGLVGGGSNKGGKGAAGGGDKPAEPVVEIVRRLVRPPAVPSPAEPTA